MSHIGFVCLLLSGLVSCWLFLRIIQAVIRLESRVIELEKRGG